MNYPREFYDTWRLMTPEEYQEYLHGRDRVPLEVVLPPEEEEDDDAECE